MALCISCGKDLKEGALFCPFCGSRQPSPAASPAPVQPAAPAQPVQPVQYQAPVRYAAPVPPPKKKSKAPLIIGIVAGAVLLIVVLILLFVFVILPIFGAGGGNASKPQIYGKYYAVSVKALGIASSPDGEWVELKRGGRGTFYSSGNEYKLKWSLDGEEFTGTVTFLILDMDMTGTLKDGVLSVEYGLYDYVFVLEGTESPLIPAESATGSE